MMNDQNKRRHILTMKIVAITFVATTMFHFGMVALWEMLFQAWLIHIYYNSGEYNAFVEFLFVYRSLLQFFLTSIWVFAILYIMRSYYLRQIMKVYHMIHNQTKPKTHGNLQETNTIIEKKQQLDEKQAQMIDRYTNEKLHKGDAIIYLAHDLKTPLTSIIGYFYLLKDKKIERECDPTYFPIIEEKLNRLEQLRLDLEELLTMEQKPPLHKRRCDVVKMLTTLVQDLQRTSNGHSFIMHGDASVLLDGDETLLHRLFSNLLRNALMYASAESEIHLNCKERGGEVWIQITNRTQDLKQADIAHLFEKFYRKDEARSTKQGGAGLGLAIAKEIVEQHLGSLSATLQGDLLCMNIKLPYQGDESHVSSL